MKIVRLALVPALLALVAGAACAQTWPSRPVRVLVGFAPGGGTDIVGRVVAQKLAEYWGQGVTVENRPGATGVIAADLTAKAPADGYTLMVGHVNSHAIAPNLMKKLPYDAIRDFSPITYLGYAPNVLVVHPSIPARTVKELITVLKGKPGSYNFASSGTGSTQHLAGEMFKLLTGTQMVHVPYKGSGQAITDLLAGVVSMNFDTLPSVIDHVRGGRLRALSVSTPQRLAVLPEVATFTEEGITGFDVTNWYGFMGPGGMPRDLVAKIGADINRAIQAPDVRARLEQTGTQIGGGTPDQFEAFAKAEVAKYARLVKDAHITLD